MAVQLLLCHLGENQMKCHVLLWGRAPLPHTGFSLSSGSPGQQALEGLASLFQTGSSALAESKPVALEMKPTLASPRFSAQQLSGRQSWADL